MGSFFPPEITIAQRTERRRAAGNAQKAIAKTPPAKKQPRRNAQRPRVRGVRSFFPPEIAIAYETKRKAVGCAKKTVDVVDSKAKPVKKQPRRNGRRPRVRGAGSFFPPEIAIAQRTERRRAAAGDAQKVVVAAAKNKRKRSNQRANVCFVGSSHSLPETAITRETKRETIDIG